MQIPNSPQVLLAPVVLQGPHHPTNENQDWLIAVSRVYLKDIYSLLITHTPLVQPLHEVQVNLWLQAYPMKKTFVNNMKLQI